MSVEQIPLAERMRPKTLEEYVGQSHLVGANAPLRVMLERGHIPSMILWGPPGVGKTTLARLLSQMMQCRCYSLSAVGSGVADVRKTLQEAKETQSGLFSQHQGRPILFIDEIHRFSKSQQDSLLAAVEQGVVTLIGATTENPSFQVIRPLLSRCQVFVLKPLEHSDLSQLIDRVFATDPLFSRYQVTLEGADRELLIHLAGGDARKLLNLLEMTLSMALEQHPDETAVQLTGEAIASVARQQPAAFDRDGELHYDIASAFIKSIRGSAPDAALYWMARLIEGGEEPRFIARRVVISAAEDIGLANPQALVVAQAAADAVDFIGWPEGRIPLAEAVVYLAGSPKSNSAYLAIDAALAKVRETGNLPVPLHLRNAPTKLMSDLGYGVDYRYPHDYPKHYTRQQYLPDELVDAQFYTPQQVGQAERTLSSYLDFIDQEEETK